MSSFTTRAKKLTSLAIISAAAFLGTTAALADTSAEVTEHTNSLATCYQTKAENVLLNLLKSDPSTPKDTESLKQLIGSAMGVISEHPQMSDALSECVAQIMHVDAETANNSDMEIHFDLPLLHKLMDSKQDASAQNVLKKMTTAAPQP